MSNIKNWMIVVGCLMLVSALPCRTADSALAADGGVWQAGNITVGLDGGIGAGVRLEIEDVVQVAQSVDGTASRHGVSWPTSREGLVFCWCDCGSYNFVTNPAAHGYSDCRLRGRGWARFDESGAMSLTGGSYYLECGNEELLAELKGLDAISIEATIMPQDARQSGPARIVSFSSSALSRNFTLGQEGDGLVLRLRTNRTDENAVNSQTRLCRLYTDRPNHVIVSYKSGRLVCYQNGRQVFTSKSLQGDFRNWSLQYLVFGDEWNGERDWTGKLEGVAIYKRFIEPDEAHKNFESYTDVVRERDTAPGLEVRLRLVQDKGFAAPGASIVKAAERPIMLATRNGAMAPELDDKAEIDPEQADEDVEEAVEEVPDEVKVAAAPVTQAPEQRGAVLPAWGWTLFVIVLVGAVALLLTKRVMSSG